MLDALKDFLRTVGIDTRSPGAARRLPEPAVAAAALLCHVAEADGRVSEAEFARLQAAVAAEFGLDPRDAAEVAEAGREADADAVDLFRFTSVLTATLTHEQRLRFVGLLWSVVYVDGAVHELEDNLVWRIAELLGVSARDRMLLKGEAMRTAAVDGDAPA